MNPQIDHDIAASVFLWLDYVLAEKNAGFKNYTGTFTGSQTPLNGWNSYAAPQRQFVYDSSIPGSIVPTGVYIDSNFTPVSATGRINYNKGEFISTAAQSATVSGAYSYKEVNLYNIRVNEEYVLFDKIFSENPKANGQRTEAFEWAAPCILIRNRIGDNTTLCFDGLSSTVIPIRLTLLADTTYLYDNVRSILRDRKETFVPIFNTTELPFDFYGGLVSGSFDYTAARDTIQMDSSRLAYVKDVSISDFSMEVNSVIGTRVFGGFVDLDLELLRFPRTNA